MKNPLRRRLLRELRQDIGKYIALFLFLSMTAGMVSGFIVAAGSMKTAYDESFSKYSVESGHFILEDKLPEETKARLEEEAEISVCELLYKDVTLDNENTVRIYKNRTELNRVCLMDGALPENDGEIAADRLYLENNSLGIGDELAGLKITGIVALSDYSALFKNNTDMMLDANKFCVAVVSPESFDKINENLHYCYAWLNNDESLSDEQCRDKADDIAQLLSEDCEITELVRRADDQAIMFTGEDIGGDKAMMITLLYVVIVILGFVFAVTTRSTIEQESGTVGTLLASGYTRRELIRHYMAMPIIVTLLAALAGNILGYTVFKDYCASLYYHSYSLTTYVTLWNAEAFIKTTLVPCVLTAVTVYAVLWRMMRRPVQSFLRHELGGRGKQYVPPLRAGGIIERFRKRIILQNRSAYITLLIGILFANVLLLFGLIMPPVLDNFKDEVLETKLSDYQYLLKAPTLTENENAEPFCISSLEYEDEEISIYGVKHASSYADFSFLPSEKGSVLVSEGFMEKYGLKRGDRISLHEKYGGKEYTFTVYDSTPYAAGLAVFMSKLNFNETFGLETWFFNGYFSNEKLTDLDPEAVSSVITEHDLTVVTDQLDDSMGRMFPLVGGFSLALYMLLVYLLSKTVIEKNAQSISMLKILGYTQREISSLYNSSTAIAVGVSLIVTIPLSAVGMKRLYYNFMSQMSGWLTFYIAPWIWPAMLGLGAATYFIIHMIQLKRLGRIPLSKALKNIE